MEKANIHGSDGRREVNPAWFTGHVWMKDVSLNSTAADMYHVHFEGGSRTKVHKHDGHQTLIVTEGKGSLEIYQADTEEDFDGSFKITKTDEIPLNVGDVVHIPHNTLHTHGSISPGETFSHVAINNLPCGVGEYITTWYNTNKNTVTGRI